MTVSSISSSSSSSSYFLSSELNIPHEFICPITHQIMKKPLMSRYGQTYEREAILTWLSNHNNMCPLTRQVLKVSDLVSHRALESRIQTWKRRQARMVGDSDDGCVEEDDDEPSLLLTCLEADLNNSEYVPKQIAISLIDNEVICEEQEDPSSMIRPPQEKCRKRLRLFRLIRSSR